MKKSVRKLLATLLALCLLTAVLPMGTMVVSADVTADTNLINNGGFEATGIDSNTGEINRKVFWSLSQNTVVSTTAAHSGNYGVQLQGNGGWGGLLQQETIAVIPGCTYFLTFWYNTVSGGANITVSGNSSGATYLSDWLQGSNGWVKYEKIFVVGNDTTLKLNFNGGNTSVVENIYMDDFALNLIKRGSVNLVSNGDFEDGDINGWSNTSSLIAAADCPVAPAGNYAMRFESTNYSYTNYRIAVEPNTDYVITCRILTDATYKNWPFHMRVHTNTEAVVAALESIKPSTTEWETFTLSFNSGSYSTLNLRYQAGWKTGIYYIDDISVEAVKANSDSAALTNGGFETGDKSSWTCVDSSTITEDSYSGKYALRIDNPAAWAKGAERSVSIRPNTNYQITWYAKRISGTGTFSMLACQTVSPWGNLTKVSGDNAMSETSGEWVKYTYVCNSGNETAMLIKFTSSAANSGVILIDDVSIVALTDPSDDGYIVNGDMECGATTGWSTRGTVSTDAAKDGNFGIHLVSDGNWIGLMRQEFQVIEGYTYRFSMDYRAMTNGVNYKLAGEESSYVSGWLEKRTWTHVEKVFRATGTTVAFNISGGGNDVATNVFVDNIKIELIPDEEVNLLEHGGKSAAEMNDEGNVGGLGFLFSANIENISYTSDDSQTEHLYTVYRYEENSAIGHPYTNKQFLNDPYDYTVLRMGAIISNKADAVATDLTVDNAVAGSNIINIVGAKAMKEMCDDAHYVYGVRVTNIPESNFDTVIYARPYITVQAGERVITLYGEMVSACYNDFMGEVTE